MAGGDWRDPFAEDPAADERERRRAEREARRRERSQRRSESQTAVGKRVKDLLQRDGEPSDDGSVEETEPLAARPAPRISEPSATPMPAANQPSEEPPTPPGGGGPRSPSDRYRRRRIAALAAIVVAIGIVGVIAAFAIHHFGGNGASAPATTAAGPVKKITIPEGEDRREIAALAKKDGIRGDYMKASESYRGFDPARYGAQSPPNLEGFLFPATYDLPKHPTANDLVVRQLAAFKQYISQVNMSYARSKNLTTYDVVTIASMIEREAQVAGDRKLVAAVIYNRLRDGMPLQVDATIRFAENNYTQPLTNSDLQINSPYNTYTNTGLPPGPIGNPGLASLQAAAHPAHAPYLYYVVKPGTCPAKLTFATTNAQFEKAKAAYDQARAAAGYKSPTC